MDKDAGPFADVNLFLQRVEAELTGSTSGVALSKEAKLRLLLENTKDVEIVMAGSLRNALLDLCEAVEWSYATPEAAKEKRQQLLTACEDILGQVKRKTFVDLAKEHDLYEDYVAQAKAPVNHTVQDYERLGELEYALIVWRQNLQRDLMFAQNKEEKAWLARTAYVDAEALLKRCLNTSNSFWNQQTRLQRTPSNLGLRRISGTMFSPRGRLGPRRESMSDMPLGGESVITVYEKAMSRVWMDLDKLAQKHNVDKELEIIVRMSRAGSHPLSFADVSAALQEHEAASKQELLGEGKSAAVR